ncbi:MAG: hypothetical protein GEV06_20775 [Luteitalea sp.]|nr:hypothetical protein [Luteitalea sp.]
MSRTTLLIRTPDLDAYQRAIIATACLGGPLLALNRLVLVPSQSAAEQLRQTIESRLLLERWRPSAAERATLGLATDETPDEAVLMPALVTRAGMYQHLHERLGDERPRLSELAREVLFRRAADEVRRRGMSPPFALRPGLLAEMLRFYDAVRRLRHTRDELTTRLIDELGATTDIDRGARRLLEQTQFLAATFAAYEALLPSTGALDEHTLRAVLIAQPAPRPVRHVIVSVADEACERGGLWPADYELLQQLPGLARVDVVATESMLASGLRKRLYACLPNLVEQTIESRPRSRVTLVAPPGNPGAAGETSAARWFVSRDREEELLLFARRLKAAASQPEARPSSLEPSLPPLDRIALVYNRPLPYLYLARQVLSGAGIPCQAFDALPLASEPYAAALDVVLEAVSSGFVRVAIVALLRSSHFLFVGEDQQPITGGDVAALDRALVDAGYLGGLDHLCRLADRWAAVASRSGTRPPEIRAARAAGAAAAAASELASLEADAPPSAHLQGLLDFLQRHARPGPLEGDRPRQLRARAAIVGALEALRDAHREFHDEPVRFADLAAVLHRWIEAQTFTPRAGRDGVHLVDADAARYGQFAGVHLAGLVDGEWPEAPTRNVFYPASLLIDLGWPREADRISAARAAFHDLMGLSQGELSVSSFLLEQDALVRPSALLEELDELDGSLVRRALPQIRVTAEEALSLAPVVSSAVEEPAAAWLALRLSRTPGNPARFRGQAGPQDGPTPSERGPRSRVFSVTAVERYLQCPFKYFAANELALEPDVEEEPGLSALQRGRLLHQVLHDFFARQPWRTELTVESMPIARQALTEVVDEALAALPEPDRTLERQRFMGTAVSTGLIDRVLRAEIARPGRITERLVEHSIEGRYLFEQGGEQRWVSVRGVVDRVDLIQPTRAPGAGAPPQEKWLRVIDYKIGRAPRSDVALQPQIYGLCLEQQLAGERGGRWQLTEAGYLALGLAEPNVPVVRSGTASSARLAEATERFLGAVDAIGRGDFRVTPAEPFLCVYCAFPTVCRKDYVGDE